MFEIRNKMTNIPANFQSDKENKSKCICGKKENNEHIYICEKLNKEKPTIKYEHIFGDNLKMMKNVLSRFEKNMIERERNLHQEILICDPLRVCSNG